mmetsp:Transcript_76546/g.216434  ORF Transcript_76546/g.216434 Transcript_76546/m.216434 type:complete len:263 (-) Transcript_76546:321-1109(-)
MSKGSERNLSKSMLDSSTCSCRLMILLPMYLRTRTAVATEILWCWMYRLRWTSCFACSLFMFRKCVMAFVIELTNEENEIKAKTRTNRENVRSVMFVGYTSMEAGVNCVSDQCKDVVYLYGTDVSSKLNSTTQASLSSRMPMAYHAQAMTWLMMRMHVVSFTMPINTAIYSDCMCSSIRIKYRGSFIKRISRSIRSRRMIRTVLPTRAMPRFSMLSPPVSSSSPKPRMLQSMPTRKKSSANHVIRYCLAMEWNCMTSCPPPV